MIPGRQIVWVTAGSALFFDWAAAVLAGSFWRGELLEPSRATPRELRKLNERAVRAVVLVIPENNAGAAAEAAERICAAGLELHYP